jgi:hypothetical protein
MGLADLGIGAGGPYSYNSTSFAANLTLNSFSAYSPGYAEWLDAPDWLTISLDTVAVGIPLNGSQTIPPEGTFWMENAIRFNGSEVQFEDNIWNFSGPGSPLEPTTLQAGAALQYSSVTGATYYQRWGPMYMVSYPLTLALVNTIGVVAGRPVLYFNYSVSSPSTSQKGSYDEVEFNRSISAGDAPRFDVNGSGLNPYGLRDDAELVFTGDGAGSNADIATINGTATLDYWDDGAYIPISSAYDYGDDSGGTSEGIATYFQGATEFLNAGPSFVYGLWNTTNSELGPAAMSGWIHVQAELDPEYGVLMATNLSGEDATAGGNFSFVPTAVNGEIGTDLPPPPPSEPYIFEGWADGFEAAQASISGNGSGNVSLSLASDAASYDAPLYFDGAGQVAAFGAAGGPGVSYNVQTDTLTLENRSVALPPPFRRLNDYGYPALVLFAAENLAGTAIDIVGIDENASSFNVTFYGRSATVQGVTQDYSFDNVSEGSSVRDLDLAGNGAARYTPGSLATLPAVEIFDSEGVRASNVSSNGPVGVAVVDSTGVVATNVSAWDDGTAVEFFDTSNTEVADLAAAEGGTAVVANDSCNLTVDDVTVGASTLAAGSFNYGIIGAHLENVTLDDWDLTCPFAPSRVGGESPINVTCSYGGWINWGSHLRIENFSSVNSSGINLGYSTDIWGWNLTARGFWAEAMLGILHSSDGVFENLNASESASAMYNLTWDRNFTFINLAAASGGSDVAVLNLSTDASFTNINVSGQAVGVEGINSTTDLAFTNISSSADAEGVGGTNLTNLTFTSASANSGSAALILFESYNVTAADIRANNGSLGVSLSDTDHATVSNVRSVDRSVALTWWTGTFGTISNLTAMDDAADVQLVGLKEVTVSGVSETNSRPGSAYFYNNFTGIIYPDGPVQTNSDPDLVITNVTAVNCSFALQDIDSESLQVSDVRSWGSGTAIQLNGTEYSSIERLFAESDTHGLILNSVLNITVTASTIEDSTSYGIYLTDGLNETFYGNNFVANDGASAFGVYDPAHPQVNLALVKGTNFTWDGIGNYWSDWSNPTPYPVGAGINDSAPAPRFLTSWLSFVAQNLTPEARWTVSVAEDSYSATAPLVVIPSWVLPAGTLSYGIAPPTGWGVSPRSGEVAYNGTNQSVNLTFTLPEYTVRFVETGLPSGTSWNVTLAATPSSGLAPGGPGVLAFMEPNGTYPASVGAVPGFFETTVEPGSEVRVFGANLTVAVPFDRVVFPLTLVESGLPTGTPWGATVNGTFEGTNGSLVGWGEPNGTYTYNLSGISGWHENSLPYRGTLTVSNGSLVVQVAWFPERYSVTFSESGLPNGTTWNVVLGGHNVTVTGSMVGFSLSNGTYAFRVFPTLPTSIRGTPSFGNLTISGNATVVNITFVAATLVFRSGPAPNLALYLGLGIAAGLIVLVAWAVRRRQPPNQKDTAEGTEGPMGVPAREDDSGQS